MWLSERSVRAGAALCSTATPTSAARLKHLLKIYGVGVALEELAAGGMGQNADTKGLSRARIIRAVMTSLGWSKREWILAITSVKLGQSFVGEVKLAFSEDVALDAGEEAEGSLRGWRSRQALRCTAG